VVNRTTKGRFVKGESGNPLGRPKDLSIPPVYAPDLTAADRRPIPNLVVEARKYSGLAVDTLVELTKNTHTDSTRYNAATALLDRGRGQAGEVIAAVDVHRARAAHAFPARAPERQRRIDLVVDLDQGICPARLQRPRTAPRTVSMSLQ
jgi:hypothetical protein